MHVGGAAEMRQRAEVEKEGRFAAQAPACSAPPVSTSNVQIQDGQSPV